MGRRQNRGNLWVRVVGRIGYELSYVMLWFCVRREGCPLGESGLDAMAH